MENKVKTLFTVRCDTTLICEKVIHEWLSTDYLFGVDVSYCDNMAVFTDKEEALEALTESRRRFKNKAYEGKQFYIEQRSIESIPVVTDSKVNFKIKK